MVPFGNKEIGIGGGKACNEVFFPSLYGTLSCVSLVDMRGNSLERNILFGESRFHVIRALVF